MSFRKLRLPLLLIVVVAVIGLVLPAATTSADYPRVTSVYLTHTAGNKVGITAKDDKAAGTVTFAAKLHNFGPSWLRNVALRMKVPDGMAFVESWCSLPGRYTVMGPGPDGWIAWARIKTTLAPFSTTNTCGFTMAGWDGKSTLETAAEFNWATDAGGWIDDENQRVKQAVMNFKWPLPTDKVTVIGKYQEEAVAGHTWVAAIEKRLKAVEDKLGGE